MITIDELYKSESECCGCGSCADVCPKSVLSMKADKSGFLYPVVEHGECCIDCKLCISVCPEKNYQAVCSDFIDFYAGYLEDQKELVSCASGGLATALSRNFLNHGGVVYGCAYSEDWRSIEYIKVTNESEINRLKTSKYAQSVKGNIYHQIIEDLNSGIKVLFIGLPCEVLSVRVRIPRKLQESLYLVELVCHGPTSQEVHRQYLDSAAGKNDDLIYFSTREKKNGEWKPFYICAKYKNGNTLYEQFHKSSYGAAFRYLKRPSCYSCKIKGEHLAGDLMIGDYHYVEKGMKGYNRHGVSSALVHNPKGKALLDGIENIGFYLMKINKRGALGNGAITKAIPAPDRQAQFRRVFESEGLDKASNQGYVKKSSLQRTLKETIMHYGVIVKRIVVPSSRPHD